jgi:hypothetical protein
MCVSLDGALGRALQLYALQYVSSVSKGTLHGRAVQWGGSKAVAVPL